MELALGLFAALSFVLFLLWMDAGYQAEKKSDKNHRERIYKLVDRINELEGEVKDLKHKLTCAELLKSLS